MHTEHADFHAPREADVAIWRYVDLPRYLSLLTTRSLYLSRVDLLGDDIEGTISAPTVQGDYVDPRRPTSLAGLQDALRRLRETQRKNVAVSCWHIADYESAGMWIQYAESGKGVAIKSTYARLIKSLESWPRDFFAGCVSYADYDRDVITGTTMLAPFVHKPKEYQHEQELRIVVSQLPARIRPMGFDN
jgi:hypothetical protein